MSYLFSIIGGGLVGIGIRTDNISMTMAGIFLVVCGIAVGVLQAIVKEMEAQDE